MSDHYSWQCDICGHCGDIYDDEYLLTLNKTLDKPHGSRKGTKLVTVCDSCDTIIGEGNTVNLMGCPEQNFNQTNVIERT